MELSMTGRTLLITLFLSMCVVVSGVVFSGTSNMEALVPRKTPDGWALRNSPQAFTKRTLFEHINGQADLFLEYGFEGSIFAVYQNTNSSQERIDLNIYDMGNVVQAFGIFSRFRQGVHPAGVGLDSFLEDQYALFYKGKYFVVLQATESDPSGLRRLARVIDSRLTGSSSPPKEIGYFPKQGLKPGSIEYYPKGLMGRKFLGRGFKGTYSAARKTEAKPVEITASTEASLFVAVFDSSDEAMRALKDFEGVLSKGKGFHEETSREIGFESVKGQDAYQGTIIIVRKDNYLAGAAGFAEDEKAENLLAELVRRIE